MNLDAAIISDLADLLNSKFKGRQNAYAIRRSMPDGKGKTPIALPARQTGVTCRSRNQLSKRISGGRTGSASTSLNLGPIPSSWRPLISMIIVAQAVGRTC